MQLSHAKVGFQELLLGFISVSAHIYQLTMLAISWIAILYVLMMGDNGGAT
jgi:hypothetical protein